MKHVLVVVDYQTDFVTGALGNPAAAALEPALAARIAEHLAAGGFVLFTRDTHDADYLQTREGRFLPVPHCVAGTPGWHLHGALAQYEAQPQLKIAFVDKPTFGSADLPEAVRILCGGAPERITVCGVVTDICVVSNAIVLHTAFLDAEITVLRNLCAAATPEGHERALALLQGMGYAVL